MTEYNKTQQEIDRGVSDLCIQIALREIGARIKAQLAKADVEGKAYEYEAHREAQNQLEKITQYLSNKMPDNLVTTHKLKIWPEYFDEVLNGTKTFEVRVNDRGFKCGDMVQLQEYSKNALDYTGRELTFEIGYVLPMDERVVFSLLPVRERPRDE